jgi:hypothetical protein
MKEALHKAYLVQPARPSRLASLLRVGLEYAFWFAGALILKLVLSAWVSVPHPSPLWIPVVLLALQHGLGAGLGAALIAAGLQFSFGLPPALLSEDLYAYLGRVAFEPVAWTAVALFIGQIRSREINMTAALKARLAERTSHADTVADLCAHMRERIQTLEREIAANADASATDVAEAVIRLEHAGWDNFSACLRQFILLMTGATEFTIFLLGENGFYAVFVPQEERPGAAGAVIRPDAPLFATIVNQRRVVSAADPDGAALLQGVGIFAGPLFEAHASGRVIGMLALGSTSPEDLPHDVERRFALVSSELSPLVERIKLIDAWRDATNGQLRAPVDLPVAGGDAGDKVFHSAVEAGSRARLQ